MNNLALFLVGKKGYSVLQHITKKYPLGLISDVVASRDQGVESDYYDEMLELCNRKGVRFHARLSNTFAVESYEGFLLAIGWKWMLPSNKNVLVIHDSILPGYRGFAPLVNALINGENTIGATAILAGDEYDRGNIIAQSHRLIGYPIKIAEAIEVMCDVYVEIVDRLIDEIMNRREICGVVQDESRATYSLWRDEEDYWINWEWASERIVRFIDAVGSPYAGAYTMCNGIVGVINSAQLVGDVRICDRKSAIGKVIFLDGVHPVVVCGSGLIKIIDIKSLDGNSLIPLKKFRTRFGGKE